MAMSLGSYQVFVQELIGQVHYLRLHDQEYKISYRLYIARLRSESSDLSKLVQNYRVSCEAVQTKIVFKIFTSCVSTFAKQSVFLVSTDSEIYLTQSILQEAQTIVFFTMWIKFIFILSRNEWIFICSKETSQGKWYKLSK